MKTLLIALSLMTSLSTMASTLTFGRDDRPIDGTLKELTIKNFNVRNGAQIKLRTAWINRMTGANAEKIDLDIRGLDCLLSGRGNNLESVSCGRDERPVDGAKVEILIKKNDSENYDVIKKTTIVSRMTGEESTRTENLAENLRKK